MAAAKGGSARSGARGCGSRGRRADISSLPQRLRRLRATNAVYTPGGGGVSETSRGGVGDAPRRADGSGWDADSSEDEFATHTISHLQIRFFFEALCVAGVDVNSSRHTPRAYALSRREAPAPRRGGRMRNDAARDAFRGPEIKLLMPSMRDLLE